MKKSILTYWRGVLFVVIFGVVCLSCKDKAEDNQIRGQGNNKPPTEIEEIFNLPYKQIIGQALSVSGDLLGSWEQIAQPLNNDNGGHAKLFRDFDNKLKISYHSPNNPDSRLTIYDIIIENRNLKIVTP